MRVLVLLNSKSGTLAASATGDEPDRIRRGFEARGVEAVVRLDDGPGLAEAVAAAREGGFDAVVAGGGDGTLNTVANALAGGPVPFGVLPLGTHNHFAKELNVPLDLDAAVAALAGGEVVDLDVGEVNGRAFLNFSGIGLHPEVVRERDAQREAMGEVPVAGRVLRKAVKLLVGLFAFARKLTDLPILQVWVTAGGHTRRRITPSVIVCNNAHQMQVFGVNNISHPSRDVLNVYVARATGPVAVLRLLLAALFRRLNTAHVRDFEALALPALRIDLRRRKLPVSIDGEVVEMRTPLDYRVRRGGLKVLVPKPRDEG
jgi:diacylglycerol kinase family enzyme